jgi:hypothetical protein
MILLSSIWQHWLERYQMEESKNKTYFALKRISRVCGRKGERERDNQSRSLRIIYCRQSFSAIYIVAFFFSGGHPHDPMGGPPLPLPGSQGPGGGGGGGGGPPGGAASVGPGGARSHRLDRGMSAAGALGDDRAGE